VTPTSLRTNVAEGTTGRLAETNTLHEAVNALTIAGRSAVNVRDYGALGNGTTDDRAAIQSALDDAGTGGSVYFPPGTYRLATATLSGDRILKSYPGQTLFGDGRYASLLKVGNSFGDYKTVIGLAADGTHCGRWTFTAMGIDQNSDNGNAMNIASYATYPRMGIRMSVTTGSGSANSAITVSDAAFLNSDSLNTVYIAAQVLDISRTHFINQGGPVGTGSHDHSSIYTTTTIAGGTQTVVGNTFLGVAGSGGSRTAIETHSGVQTVTGNSISGYLKGMNLTGWWSIVTDGVSCTNNAISGCLFGINWWSYYYSPLTSGTAVRNVNISNNTISINRDLWSGLSGLSAYGCGILLDGGNDAPTEGLVINHNQITYLPSVATPPANDYNSSGIRLIISSTTAEVTELQIRGNTIKNPIAAGIFLSCVIKVGDVSDNTTINPWASSNAAISTTYRAGIVIQGTISDVTFERNKLIDNRGTHLSEYNLIATTALVSATNCVTRNNRIRYTDAATARNGFTPVSGGVVGQAFVCHENGDVRPSQPVKPGSTDLDSSGRLWTQTTASLGTNWILDHRGTGSPESVWTAPIGSRFMRTDGGAATTFYVKESGTGNTGWVAK
jgi:hypothetical protein